MSRNVQTLSVSLNFVALTKPAHLLCSGERCPLCNVSTTTAWWHAVHIPVPFVCGCCGAALDKPCRCVCLPEQTHPSGALSTALCFPGQYSRSNIPPVLWGCFLRLVFWLYFLVCFFGFYSRGVFADCFSGIKPGCKFRGFIPGFSAGKIPKKIPEPFPKKRPRVSFFGVSPRRRGAA